ncbi:MAG: hypothetical protein R3C56_07340 [Pirellulaceae bacterium]
MLQGAVDALRIVAKATDNQPQLVVVGLPLRVAGKLYNVAAAIESGKILALIPKQYLPNYQEFYEARWFIAADGNEPPMVDLGTLGQVPFGVDLLLESSDLTVGIEICEDLWMPCLPAASRLLRVPTCFSIFLPATSLSAKPHGARL